MYVKIKTGEGLLVNLLSSVLMDFAVLIDILTYENMKPEFSRVLDLNPRPLAIRVLLLIN